MNAPFQVYATPPPQEVIQISVSPKQPGASVRVVKAEEDEQERLPRLTPRRLEQKIWPIWGYVRDNAKSLDSERHCRRVFEMVEAIVKEFVSERELYEKALKRVRAEANKHRTTANRLRQENAKLLRALKYGNVSIKDLEEELSTVP